MLCNARSIASARLTAWEDRKSTRLNSSHSQISYAVFCLKKKTVEVQIETDAALAAIVRNSDGLYILTFVSVFFFNDAATTEIYTLSLHDALPTCSARLTAW